MWLLASASDDGPWSWFATALWSSLGRSSAGNGALGRSETRPRLGCVEIPAIRGAGSRSTAAAGRDELAQEQRKRRRCLRVALLQSPPDRLGTRRDRAMKLAERPVARDREAPLARAHGEIAA